MTERIIEHYDRAPSALNFMLRAIKPTQGLPKDERFPQIVVRWSGLRVGRSELQAFRQAIGASENELVSVLDPHVFGFRLQMALLTHRAFPLPIWTALQIRNRLVRHKLFDLGEALNLETQVGSHRLVAKGVEVDLLTRLTRGPECCWESQITYFYRGGFGAASSAAPTAQSPAVSELTVVDRFPMPNSGGWRFGKLTGDYNGIHCWPWYARRFGFPAALLHPQRVAGICLARLKAPKTDAQTLELWIKGPVFYGANVMLSSTQGNDGLKFAVSLERDPRAALIGYWRSGVADGRPS
ncbi:MAG TPA: acyl dehydratase [Xanthobacteraceae bacterium]|nr:acyl dehydratase [Xanthobacteraceae bacterium]